MPQFHILDIIEINSIKLMVIITFKLVLVYLMIPTYYNN
jgi:hypothetical protein